MSLAAYELAQKFAENPTKEDKIQFLKDTIKALGDPKTVSDVKKNLENLAVTAVKTDESFFRVSKYFEKFVHDYGDQFHGLAGFLKTWKGYQGTWTTLISRSRDLAKETATNYEDYDLYLQSIQDLKTVEDMKILTHDLQEFGKTKRIIVPEDISQAFSNLKTSVMQFQSDFYAYLEKQGTEVDMLAKECAERIEKLKAEINNLTKIITVALAAVGVGAWYNLVISAVALVAAGVAAIARQKLYGKLEGEQKTLAGLNEKQDALKHIKSDFDGLTPDFHLICDSLQMFSDIWAEFHKESLDFAGELSKLQEVKFPEEFALRVELARKTAIPLRDGLKEYAAKIHL